MVQYGSKSERQNARITTSGIHCAVILANTILSAKQIECMHLLERKKTDIFS
jgi:hypothetical protein